MSRQVGDTRSGWQVFVAVALGVLAGVVAAAGALAVTAAGFTLSFDAIRAVGRAAHMRHDWSWLLPVSVDGAMAVATVAAVVLHRLTGKSAWYPWAVVLAGAGVSVACNGLHATGEEGQALVLQPGVRFAVSAIPAVMLALSVHLLVVLIDVAARKVERGAGEPRGGAGEPREAARDAARDAAPIVPEPRAGAEPRGSDVGEAAPEGALDVAGIAGNGDIKAQAREVYAQSVTAEMPLTGAALARMFGKSSTWGLDRIREAKTTSEVAS